MPDLCQASTFFGPTKTKMLMAGDKRSQNGAAT
jgi:hypothetical protein